MNGRRFKQRFRPHQPLSLFNQLLQDADFGTTAAVPAEPDSIAAWVPAVDIREESDRFVLTADLPGVGPEKKYRGNHG
jgi:HSP20 family protein